MLSHAAEQAYTHIAPCGTQTCLCGPVGAGWPRLHTAMLTRCCLLSHRLQVVIATGAASGIGRAVALSFGKGGAKVVVTDFNGKGAEEVAGHWRQPSRRTAATPLPCAQMWPRRRSARQWWMLQSASTVAWM